MRKKNKKKVVLPGLMWDNEAWVPFSNYPDQICFTDKVLGEILGVTGAVVGQWRQKHLIPFTMQGVYAKFNVLEVIRSLQEAGYKVDPNKKSIEL